MIETDELRADIKQLARTHTKNDIGLMMTIYDAQYGAPGYQRRSLMDIAADFDANRLLAQKVIYGV